jgi:hypothetical protein
MAELGSGIILITTFSAKAFDNNIKFICKMRFVDRSVKKLVINLQRLRGTDTLGASGNAANKALVFIYATVITYEQSIEHVATL